MGKKEHVVILFYFLSPLFPHWSHALPA